MLCILIIYYLITLAQSAGAVEYTDCISVEGKTPSNRCRRYDTKRSDSEVPVMLIQSAGAVKYTDCTSVDR